MALSDPDELARTATAIGGSAPRGTGDAAGATLGRYRLERELGAGGMGVVHAAFDPDLERRVALKVLRGASDGTDARARLLREARAMARLTHPNVVTVFEVGSVAGRDFVAMELIDGDSLAEWMRAAPRSRRDLLDAFTAAGCGLAAAHDAGLIHRDFKPHNVLRARDGRICVTDFGLARAAELPAAGVDALATTFEIGPVIAAAASSLSGLTQTGSVLGTPAYMAPEQWAGAGVGPASDQFAFCVALWEALTGQRPYRGDTLASLRTAVERGPAALDSSPLPRAVRSILRRGLDPDPARRWPTMAALLAALTRARRSRRVELGAVVGALAIGAIAVAIVAGGDRGARVAANRPALCAPGVAEVWPAATRAGVQATHDDVVGIVDRDVAAWTTQRDLVCAATVPSAAQVACLDGVRARQAAVIRAIVAAHGSVDASAVATDLVEPAMCALANPPHLALTPSADVVAAFGLGLDRHPGDDHPDLGEVDALLARADLEPCAHAIAALARGQLGVGPGRRAAGQDAVELADRCGDDRVRADALLLAASFELGAPMIGAAGELALRRASAAVERIPQADLAAQLTAMRGEVAAQQARFDSAIALADQAAAAFAARGRVRDQLAAVLDGLEVRLRRATPADLAAAQVAVTTWRPIAARLGANRALRNLRRQGAAVAFVHGDVATWHAETAELVESAPIPVADQRTIVGDVVDVAGRPVVGAAVFVGSYISSDSVGLGEEGMSTALSRATSDAHGRFAVVASRDWATPIVQAEFEALRSRPMPVADRVHIVLLPTLRVAGRVELGGRSPAQLRVMLRPADSRTESTSEIAPITADGTFALDRVPAGNYLIGLFDFYSAVAGGDGVLLVVRAPGVSGLVLTPSTAHRVLDVIVRSTVTAPLEGVQVLLVPGTVKASTVGELEKSQVMAMRTMFARPAGDEAASAALHAQLRSGDLVAHFDTVPDGVVTVCALAVGGDFSDREFVRKLQAQIDKLAIHCEPLAADTKLGTIGVSPMKRLDP